MTYWSGNYQDTIPCCGYWTKANICKNDTNIEMNYERPSGTDTILNMYVTLRYTKSNS